ncbi:hypothetical protein CANINC_000213 [Pichia inconspicua]|uniref:Protein kinase domain-containing protein n=1 Tax=Pichia inconspicua TaxID=52247 RepID=A0A4T0X6L3_9ASCO|nr:hypothetical protein CANINC_000213 [[Candida] inconspicua]
MSNDNSERSPQKMDETDKHTIFTVNDGYNQLNEGSHHSSSTNLRDKLSRNPSDASMQEPTMSKMKMKLQLSQLQSPNVLTTPLILSPRGTPNESSPRNSDSFFPAFDALNKSHLDELLDDTEFPQHPSNDQIKITVNETKKLDQSETPRSRGSISQKSSPGDSSIRSSSSDGRPKLKNSTSSKSISKLHPLQTKLQRLTSNNVGGGTQGTGNVNSPRSPLNKFKSKNIAYQVLPEPVRPQSSILKNNINTKFTQQYQQQEKLYLAGIKNYRNKYKNVDDYYDKSVVPEEGETAIVGNYDGGELNKLSNIDSDLFESDSDYNAEVNDKDREHEALKALSNQIGSELLDKELQNVNEYTLDSNLLLDLLNRNDEIQLKNTRESSAISERLEWQTMLQTVMTGDVVTGEKTKIVKLSDLEGENLLRVGYKEDFWLGIRAKLYGRTEEEQQRLVLYHRGLVDETFEEIMNFKLELPTDQELSYVDKVKFASEKVNKLLDKYEKCQELWRTQKEMETDRPLCATPEFVNRINCLNAWTSIIEAIDRELTVLKQWVGNDDLDILRPAISARPSNSSFADSATAVFKDDRPFVEKILKEKDIENLFNKRLFTTFSHWTLKAKNSYLEYNEYFKELGLPSYLDNLFVLTNFPSKLMKEIIKTRLAYLAKLKNPTMMMIDQMLDDLKMYLRLALEIRIGMLEYCAPVEGWISFPDYQDTEFDDTIIECIDNYMDLLSKKLLFSPKGTKTFRTFKEPEELEKEYNFLQNLGFYIDDVSLTFSSRITSLFLKLINRLYMFIQNQIRGPPSDGYRLDSQRLIRWYTSSIENFGQLRRKFIRFEMQLLQYFQNSYQFKILPQKTQVFFNLLKESNHALYHNPEIAEQGVYIFVSESLVDRPYDVECILKHKYLGVDLSKIPKRHLKVMKSYHPNLSSYIDEENVEEFDGLHLDYVIVVVPPKALMWDGVVVPFNNVTKLPIGKLKRGDGMFIIQAEPRTEISEIFDIFKQFTGHTLRSSSNPGCSIPEIEEDFKTSVKLFSRISCLLIDCIPAIRNQCRGVGGCQELVNNVFIFTRDIGRDSIRNVVLNMGTTSNRGTIILRLMKLSIEWLSFIVDDCSPTDPKTFRWCVAALEFAMDITCGFNILTLDSEKFYRLKDKVAGCMSLLISHFDIMGARAKELQKSRMQNYDMKKDIYTLDDESLGSLRQHIMQQIHQIEEQRRQLQVEQASVGRVLDDTDMENQLLTYLASSFSSVSIRWQKGKFLGGGTFGSVYACINLDTGGPMAVKEIRFQDRQSIKTVVPAIKGEMSVLELLSHPNIVQFFGVEVHRDRVYIFMEYCSGGSLAGLLEYGRIEDEVVIQLYTLQMLEALAYLHQFGIMHRDVKPDNILLDHMGVIKFVDFGSAKVIQIPQHGGSSTPGSSGNNINETTNVTTNIDWTPEEPYSATSSINTMSSLSGISAYTPSKVSNNGLITSTGSTSAAAAAAAAAAAIASGEAVDTDAIETIMESRKSHALTGTPIYMSPETIKGDKNGRFGAMDIWSLGCCVLEMTTGRRPWSNLDNEFAVMYHIAAGHLPQLPNGSELSEEGLEFLRKCFTIDPCKRPSAVELLQDPWIVAIRNEAFSDGSE